MKKIYIFGGAAALVVTAFVLIKSRGADNSTGDTNISLGGQPPVSGDGSNGLNLSSLVTSDKIKELGLMLQNKIADANLNLGRTALNDAFATDLVTNIPNANRSIEVSYDKDGKVIGVSKIVLAGQKAYEDAKKKYAQQTVNFTTQITTFLSKKASNDSTIKSLEAKINAPNLSAKSKAVIQKKIDKLNSQNAGFAASIDGINAQIKVLKDALANLSNISDFTNVTGNQSSIVQK